jgi:hypothetical protein
VKKLFKYNIIWHYLLIHLIIIFSGIIDAQNFISKKAGICFRTDDNQPINRYLEYGNLFHLYNQKFTFAVNIGRNEEMTAEYVSGLAQLQSQGHELMDHTPLHRTNYISSILPKDYYQGKAGVHNINGNKVELEHLQVNTSDAKRNGCVNINHDIINSTSGEFGNFSKSDCYLFFPSLNKIVFIDESSGWIDNYQVKVTDFWRNQIDLGVYHDIEYLNFDYNNIHLTIDAIKILGEETLRLADYYGLKRPYVWIQPGGYFPHCYRNEIKEALKGNLAFKAAGIFPDPSLKVFNEYNPENDKQFGMNFGDFRDDIWTLEQCKEFIADNIAKHHVLIGENHFTWGYEGLLGGWEGFLDRVENLIEWCQEKNIPIKTYSEWSDILYNSQTDPYENIFPQLNIDNDENLIPDGYKLFESTIDKNDGYPMKEYYSLLIDKVGTIAQINHLGGLEKGQLDFNFWAKGNIGNLIEVTFTVGNNQYIYTFPTENNEWRKFNLSESTNGNTTLIIPDNISLININLECVNYNSGNVKISNMSLTKKGYELATMVFLEGCYSFPNEMNTLLNSSLPTEQPFNISPWNYQGHENVSAIPNADIVDWILVSLKQSPNDTHNFYSKAGFLLKNGKIVDIDGRSNLCFNIMPNQYYIVIEHRNHLKIMSKSSIYFQ